LSIQYGKLLAKSQILQRQVRTQPQSAGHQGEQSQNGQNHDRKVFGMKPWKVNRFNAAEVSAKDRLFL